MPGLLVEVETKTTCRVRQNREGGVGHLLDYSGDGKFNIKDVIDGRVEFDDTTNQQVIASKTTNNTHGNSLSVVRGDTEYNAAEADATRNFEAFLGGDDA